MSAPFHATSAERLAGTEQRLGRRIWSERECPDPLAKALWNKRSRWYAERRLGEIASDDDARWDNLTAMREDAANAHRTIIQGMWDTRLCDRQQARFHAAIVAVADDCVERVETAMRNAERV